jgi:hypothetical protein
MSSQNRVVQTPSSSTAVTVAVRPRRSLKLITPSEESSSSGEFQLGNLHAADGITVTVRLAPTFIPVNNYLLKHVDKTNAVVLREGARVLALLVHEKLSGRPITFQLDQKSVDVLDYLDIQLRTDEIDAVAGRP